MKKRIAAMVLAFALLTAAGTAPAAAEGFTYNFESGSPHCGSLLMLNVDTDTIVYSLNADEPRPMASLTKIMSYIVAYENIPDIYNTKITIPESVVTELDGTDSSVSGILPGEIFTGIELLNLMMIPSGNDAALALAKYVDGLGITEAAYYASRSQSAAGSEAESAGDDAASASSGSETGGDPNKVLTFVDMMNLKAAELGCKNTHFMNAHGLHDPGHYASARDMMIISKYATTLPEFTEITKSRTYYLEATENHTAKERTTTNRMLLEIEEYYYKYATGIKTGSLNESGYCIVASATYEGYTYIVVAMGSPFFDPETGERINTQGEMLDSRELFRWAFNNLQMKTIATAGELMGNVDLKYAWKQDKLQVVAGENVNAVLPENVENSSIIPKLILPESVETPVKKGDVIGEAILTYADEEIAKVTLVAAESVERSEIMKTLEQGKEVFTSTWFLVVVGIIVLLVAIYIILIILYRNKQKRLKQVRRFRDM